jgi:hypothetical protein
LFTKSNGNKTVLKILIKIQAQTFFLLLVLHQVLSPEQSIISRQITRRVMLKMGPRLRARNRDVSKEVIGSVIKTSWLKSKIFFLN